MEPSSNGGQFLNATDDARLWTEITILPLTKIKHQFNHKY